MAPSKHRRVAYYHYAFTECCTGYNSCEAFHYRYHYDFTDYNNRWEEYHYGEH